MYLSGFEGFGNDEISECIASCGDQLEHCLLKFLSKKQIELVESSSTNFKFDLYIGDGGLVSVLNILVDKIDDIAVCDSRRDPRSLADWNGCANLQRLKFDIYINRRHARLLMKKPKYHLRSLDIEILLPYAPSICGKFRY